MDSREQGTREDQFPLGVPIVGGKAGEPAPAGSGEPPAPVSGEAAAAFATDGGIDGGGIVRDAEDPYAGWSGDQLRMQVSMYEQENTELRSSLVVLEEKYDALSLQADRLGAERTLLQSRLSAAQAESASLRAQTTTLAAKVGELQTAGERQRQQIASLTQQKTALHEQLREKIVRSSRMPDDFASAVGHSIDTIQTRLAGLSNPVTDFAVREFSIDARVAVNVTPMGTVEYRFIQPGESIDPAAISNLSMTVVPVPKQSAAGAWLPTEFTPTVGIEEIPGVGRQVRAHLNDQGIFTVADLVHAGSRVRSSVELAALLDVDRARLAEWLAHAELLTIRDIDGGMSGVLFEIGVRTLDALAAAQPEELAARFNQQLVRTGRKRVQPVDAAAVTPWIRTARAYVGRQAAAQPAPTPAPTPPTPPAPTSPAPAPGPVTAPINDPAPAPTPSPYGYRYGYGAGFTGVGGSLV
jgi:predicted flap endonuclease-1-like 5' DNA nuclease